MSERRREEVEGSIAFEDVDDVIGLADELERKHADRLPLADLYAVGADLGVSPEAIDRARAELIRRREDAARARAEEALRRRRLWTRVGVAVASALALWLGVGLVTTAGLGDLHAQVQAQLARTQNVMARREAVRRIVGDPEGRSDAVAELVGAENRVRVEASRYADAAAAYNARAGQAAARVGLWIRGLPPQVPATVEEVQQ